MMLFTELPLSGAYAIDLQRLEDERGFFARAWCQKEFAAHGLNATIVQCNMSFNPKKGTLRGMHYQVPPYEETKLIRCITGAIYDVIIDLRPHSATYMQWFGLDLTADNRRLLFVPEGFAHGYQSLSDTSEVFYQVSQFYQPGAEQGIRWNDPAFGITWPEVNHRILSVKDQSWPDFTPTQAAVHPALALS
jgi:dTDP-4-dehydrorhamnose 3,5-epimerase